jgi:hypothetical protein
VKIWGRNKPGEAAVHEGESDWRTVICHLAILFRSQRFSKNQSERTSLISTLRLSDYLHELRWGENAKVADNITPTWQITPSWSGHTMSFTKQQSQTD